MPFKQYAIRAILQCQIFVIFSPRFRLDDAGRAFKVAQAAPSVSRTGDCAPHHTLSKPDSFNCGCHGHAVIERKLQRQVFDLLRITASGISAFRRTCQNEDNIARRCLADIWRSVTRTRDRQSLICRRLFRCRGILASFHGHLLHRQNSRPA